MKKEETINKRINNYYRYRNNFIDKVSKEVIKIGIELSKTKEIKKELCTPKCASCLVVKALHKFEDKYESMSFSEHESIIHTSMFELASKLNWKLN